jgi:hypothetical protein
MELTEVVYVYRGLRAPSTLRYREILRRDFETRFGRSALDVALEPAVLQSLFSVPP